MTQSPIPPLSLHGYDRDFAGFARAMGDSYARYGFAVIANHGLPAPVIDGWLARLREFTLAAYEPLDALCLPVGVRSGAHEEINVLTLLLGAEEAGPQILDHDGRWLPIDPPPGCITDGVPDRHPSPIAADGYLQQRLREIGLL